MNRTSRADIARASPSVEPLQLGVSTSETSEDGQLFRPQAVHYARRRLQGEVILVSSISSKVFAAGLMLVAIGAIAFLSMATFDRKERVSGWVQPEGGLIRASALEAGLLEELLVPEGVEVLAGTPIARLRLAHASSAGDTSRLLLLSLQNEGGARQDQHRATQQALAERRSALAQQLAYLDESIAAAREREELAEQRLTLAEKDHARTQLLTESDALPISRLETSRSTVLGVRTTVSQSRSMRLDLEQKRREVEQQLATIATEEAAARASSELEREQLAQRVTATASQNSYVVNAPITGKVLAIPVDVGQVLPAGGTVAVLAPTGSTLVADLFVPSRAAGFIRVGQTVRVMYQAFPYEKFGAANGRVERVSNTVLGPREIPVPGLDLSEPVFRVRVSLAKQAVEAYGQQVPVQPGMLIDANIVIDRRSLLEWILDPLYAIGRL